MLRGSVPLVAVLLVPLAAPLAAADAATDLQLFLSCYPNLINQLAEYGNAWYAATSDNVQQAKCKLKFMPVASSITSDSAFWTIPGLVTNKARGVIGGDGTPGNPFIIGGHEWDCRVTGQAITLQDTNAHVLVTGNWFHDCGTAVSTYRSSNVRIEGNRFSKVNGALRVGTNEPDGNVVIAGNVFEDAYPLVLQGVPVSSGSTPMSYAIRLLGEGNELRDVVVASNTVRKGYGSTGPPLGGAYPRAFVSADQTRDLQVSSNVVENGGADSNLLLLQNMCGTTEVLDNRLDNTGGNGYGVSVYNDQFNCPSDAFASVRGNTLRGTWGLRVTGMSADVRYNDFGASGGATLQGPWASLIGNQAGSSLRVALQSCGHLQVLGNRVNEGGSSVGNLLHLTGAGVCSSADVAGNTLEDWQRFNANPGVWIDNFGSADIYGNRIDAKRAPPRNPSDYGTLGILVRPAPQFRQPHYVHDNSFGINTLDVACVLFAVMPSGQLWNNAADDGSVDVSGNCA